MESDARPTQWDSGGVIDLLHAVSDELALDRLVCIIAKSAVEASGAERALLLSKHGDELLVEAEATTRDVTIRRAPISPHDLPGSILRRVLDTKKNVIVDDAIAEREFADEYLVRNRSRSVFCVPLIHQNRLTGALYLENPCASHAFTPARVHVLRLLACQGAISIKNARLYDDLRRTEASLRTVQSELAHVSRVTTMGELAASISLLVNQPIAGVLINANAGLNWLERLTIASPNLDETREALQRIIRDGERAAEIIARIRALFKKGPRARTLVSLNETIAEVLTLSRNQIDNEKVALSLDLNPDLPQIVGDRVQLQQVILNLILNAIEAMAAVEGPRQLTIATLLNASGDIQVTVRDSGTGFGPGTAERLFEPFHTTKPAGLGMGLSISRSIISDHAGSLSAQANDGPGVVFQFTLPTAA